MLKLDKKTVSYFEKRDVRRIKILFCFGGCNGLKVDIVENFKIDDTLVPLTLEERWLYLFQVYVEKRDKEKFKNATITRQKKVNHAWVIEENYVYSSPKVVSHCDCSGSFSLGNDEWKTGCNGFEFLNADFQV